MTELTTETTKLQAPSSRTIARPRASARELEVMMVTNAVMPDQLGGLQRYVRELAGAVAARDARVTVLTKRLGEAAAREWTDDGVEIRRYEVPARDHTLYAALYPLAAMRAVGRAISAAGGVVHVHYPLQGAAPALTGAPYVHTFHAPIHRELLPEHQDRYALPRGVRAPAIASARAGEAFVARRSRATIVLTRYMRSQLSELSAGAAARAQLIPGGLDAGRFCPGPGIDHPFAAAADPLLFTARRLVPRTGVAQLVQAMPWVIEELPGARLVIAGDGPLAGDLEAMIERLSLADNVVLLGRVSEDDLLAWYRAASLFVMPTQELEGFGISTIEALACGTPAVGTPVGGTPEILEKLDRRLLAAGRSPSEIAEAILSVSKPEGVLEALAAKARRRVVPEMTWPTIADRHLEIYERVCHGRPH